MQKMTEIDRQALDEIDRLLERMYSPLAGFRKIIKTLLSLGIATRIESSHAERADAGFLVFADDLKELAALIESRSCQVFKKLGNCAKRCRSAWDEAGTSAVGTA